MAYENWSIKAAFTAGEALNTSGHEGVAIALDDGKVANNAKEATGILYDKPASGQNGSMVILGVGKGRAGGALAKGQRVTVSTSGYFTAAASGDYHAGRAWEAITSGSLGPILFHGAAHYQVSSL